MVTFIGESYRDYAGSNAGNVPAIKSMEPVMNTRNATLFRLNNRLQSVDTNKRKRVMGRIIADYDEMGIFDPIEDDDDFDFETSCERADDNDRIIEDRVVEKEQHYNIARDSRGMSEDREREVRQRCGKTDMHEAVLMRDFEMIRRIYESDPDSVKVKNNSGHTPITVAVIEEDAEMISLFKELGAIADAA